MKNVKLKIIDFLHKHKVIADVIYFLSIVLFIMSVSKGRMMAALFAPSSFSASYLGTEAIVPTFNAKISHFLWGVINVMHQATSIIVPLMVVDFIASLLYTALSKDDAMKLKVKRTSYFLYAPFSFLVDVVCLLAIVCSKLPVAIAIMYTLYILIKAVLVFIFYDYLKMENVE